MVASLIFLATLTLLSQQAVPLVNGVPVIEKEQHFGTRPGRILRKNQAGR